MLLLDIKQQRALISGCLKNDRTSQETLYRHYFTRMFRMCMRYTSDEDLAMQIVNDGFLKVFMKIDSFRYEGSLEGWIRKLVFHALSDHFRKKKNQFRFIGLENSHKVEFANNAITNLQLEEILNLIKTLPEVNRKVFELFALEGFSHADIADQMGISEGTSRWYLSKARKQLKELLHKQNIKSYVG